MTLVLSKSEKATIFRLRLEASLAAHTGKGALPRDKMLEAASKLFASFDTEPGLSDFPAAALVAELKKRKAAAEAEAA